MTRLQIGTVAGAVVLFGMLYFGFSTKSAQPLSTESGEETAPSAQVSPETILQMATAQLPQAAAGELQQLEQDLNAHEAAEKSRQMKRISGWWYAEGNVPAAGIWAERAAELEKSDTAWSVAGATFYQALVGSNAPVVRQFAAEHAVKGFENAASINPGRVEHQVNLALVYAENPPPDNPMKAVLLLRDLESQHPENAAVYNALGRLAIKTRQWEKAVERLEKAYELEPDNPNTPCLLAQAYQGQGNNDKAAEYAEKCRSNNGQ